MCSETARWWTSTRTSVTTRPPIPRRSSARPDCGLPRARCDLACASIEEKLRMRIWRMRTRLVWPAIVLCAASVVQGQNWNAVEAAMGRPSVAQPGDVHRFNFPRTDLTVVATGVTLKPAFALGGWVAMKAHGDGVVAMGDLVLLEDEVTP